LSCSRKLFGLCYTNTLLYSTSFKSLISINYFELDIFYIFCYLEYNIQTFWYGSVPLIRTLHFFLLVISFLIYLYLHLTVLNSLQSIPLYMPIMFDFKVPKYYPSYFSAIFDTAMHLLANLNCGRSIIFAINLPKIYTMQGFF